MRNFIPPEQKLKKLPHHCHSILLFSFWEHVPRRSIKSYTKGNVMKALIGAGSCSETEDKDHVYMVLSSSYMYSNINMGVGRESKHKCNKLASLWHTYYSRRSKIEGIWNFTKGLFLNEVTYSSFDEFPVLHDLIAFLRIFYFLCIIPDISLAWLTFSKLGIKPSNDFLVVCLNSITFELEWQNFFCSWSQSVCDWSFYRSF